MRLIDLNLEIYQERHAPCRVTRWLFPQLLAQHVREVFPISRPSGPKRATMVRRRSRRS